VAVPVDRLRRLPNSCQVETQNAEKACGKRLIPDSSQFVAISFLSLEIEEASGPGTASAGLQSTD